MSTTNAPATRCCHTVVWTGTEMIVWGGGDSSGTLNTGGRYNPTTDTWTSMSTVNAPSPRYAHIAVWTGTEMIVWGGESVPACGGSCQLNTGARYNPTTDTWTPVSTVNAPSARWYHTAVWTGTEMIVWGGGEEVENTGGRYNPGTDTWTPTSTVGAPTARHLPVAVWTGTEMIVWGGQDDEHGPTGFKFTNTGGKYNPVTDAWTSMTTTSAPHGRFSQSIWTGTEMIVWGGTGGGNPATTGPYYHLNSGGRYSPGTDSWTPTTLNGAPTCRSGNAMVWTGTEMIVQGGYNSVSLLSDGGRYSTTVGSNVAPTLCEPAPTIGAITFSPTDPYAGSAVTASASFTYPFTSEANTASWNWGDGNTTTGTITEANGSGSVSGSHTYTAAGTYTVTLTVTDSTGLSATSQATVNVLVNAAPSVGAITVSSNPVQVNTATNASAPFTDANVGDTHTASWNWGDGNTTTGTVTESNGSGSVSDSHIYTTTGVYTVTLTVTDNHSGTGTSQFQYAVVYDPDGGYVTGAGTINSPTGAYTADLSLTGLAHFGFNSKYAHGANVPTGNTKFRFQAGDLKFESTSYEWLVVAGAKAQYKGVGTINGSGNFGFLLSAIDGDITGGGGSDKFRIKIWDKNNNDTIVYDNQPGAAENADATTVVNLGSSIVIHP